MPPNMSVSTITPSPVSTSATASMMSWRRCSLSSSGPMEIPRMFSWGADDMLGRGDELLGKAAMGDEDEADHARLQQLMMRSFSATFRAEAAPSRPHWPPACRDGGSGQTSLPGATFPRKIPQSQSTGAARQYIRMQSSNNSFLQAGRREATVAGSAQGLVKAFETFGSASM